MVSIIALDFTVLFVLPNHVVANNLVAIGKLPVQVKTTWARKCGSHNPLKEMWVGLLSEAAVGILPPSYFIAADMQIKELCIICSVFG